MSPAFAKPGRPLVELFHEAEANPAFRKATYGFTNGPASIRVQPGELERRSAEMTSCSAYIAGAAQRPGKPRKIDSFHLHTVTAALALAVLIVQPWIDVAVKARLVEWKTRVDLVWYVSSGAVELHLEHVLQYTPEASAGMD
ncbi:hypothetical protein BJX96DRAFT_178237 [Aspergillus floccosus]